MTTKFLIMLEDKPTEHYGGCLTLIKYRKQAEYLTMETRYVNSLKNMDTSKEFSDQEKSFEEIAVCNEDIVKLRDFLNSLDLDVSADRGGEC